MSNNSFFKIYTGDYSKEGYDNGISDATASKPSSGWALFKAVSIVNWAGWQFNQSIDSYNTNYKHGHLDGQRVNNNVYSPNQQKGNNMNSDSFANQLRMVEEVRHNLVALKKYISEKRDEYKKQIEVSGNAGFASEIVDQLTVKYNAFSQKIDNITAVLERHDNSLNDQEGSIRRMIDASQQ